MWMNALRTTEDAVNLQLVLTSLAASVVPVILDTQGMGLTAQVRYFYRPFVDIARRNECNYPHCFLFFGTFGRKIFCAFVH